MTEFAIKLLDLLKEWIGKLPNLSVESGVLSNMIGGLDTVMDFISVTNFLIPLDHILIALGAVYGIRQRKFIIAILNWVIRRIADFFP